MKLDEHEKDLEIDLIVEELEPRSTWGDLGAMTFLALLAAENPATGGVPGDRLVDAVSEHTETRQQQRAFLRAKAFIEITKQYGGESRPQRRKMALAKARRDYRTIHNLPEPRQ